MKSSEKQQTSDLSPKSFRSGDLFLPFVSVLALGATFLASISNLEFGKKITIFLTIVIFYILFCAALYFWKNRRAVFVEIEEAEEIFSAEVERQLLALEEASQFFGASLKPPDMFRFASSRLREIVPFTASALFLSEEGETDLRVAGANGENSRELLGLGKISRGGLAGKALFAKKIQRDERLLLEKNAILPEALQNLKTAIAVPLFEKAERIFGVLTLYGSEKERFDERAGQVLEAAAERIAPLILSSLAFERSLSNALTDALTNLPNERAFYLILENQIAEAQRRREERPLTVLSIDIKNFNEINQKFGHAMGDKVLAFVSGVIKKQLRKMDFLARAAGDEFLAVLPTASFETAQEIVERIERVFQTAPYRITPQQNQFIKLNLGAATFLKDGETAADLLQTARLKKATVKAGADAKIIWFPREFVN